MCPVCISVMVVKTVDSGRIVAKPVEIALPWQWKGRVGWRTRDEDFEELTQNEPCTVVVDTKKWLSMTINSLGLYCNPPPFMTVVRLYQAVKVHYIDAAAKAQIVSKPADVQILRQLKFKAMWFPHRTFRPRTFKLHPSLLLDSH